MAVYKRGYRPYSGEMTPHWSRFLIITRYARESVFKSKLFTGYFVLCLIPFLVVGTIIYLYNNPVARTLVGLQANDRELSFAIDGWFFYQLLSVQGTMAFLMTAWIGPGLVAPDLTNNALPLYLSRPLSRVEYVLGKSMVLVWIISFITWIPDLFLYCFQAALAGDGWFFSHLRIAWAILAGSFVWIAVLALLALALSAWVRWRIAASGLMVGIFFVSAGFSTAFNQVLRTYWGNLMNLPYLMAIIWQGLFNVPTASSVSREFGRNVLDKDIPVGLAWVAVGIMCLICLALLNRKLRAREVVR